MAREGGAAALKPTTAKSKSKRRVVEPAADETVDEQPERKAATTATRTPAAEPSDTAQTGTDKADKQEKAEKAEKAAEKEFGIQDVLHFLRFDRCSCSLMFHAIVVMCCSKVEDLAVYNVSTESPLNDYLVSSLSLCVWFVFDNDRWLVADGCWCCRFWRRVFPTAKRTVWPLHSTNWQAFSCLFGIFHRLTRTCS